MIQPLELVPNLCLSRAVDERSFAVDLKGCRVPSVLSPVDLDALGHVRSRFPEPKQCVKVCQGACSLEGKWPMRPSRKRVWLIATVGSNPTPSASNGPS